MRARILDVRNGTGRFWVGVKGGSCGGGGGYELGWGGLMRGLDVWEGGDGWGGG